MKAMGMQDNVLSVRGLGVNFGALKAVSDLSFDAPQGRITAIIGPNGSGKSTTFNLISGAITPKSGEIKFEGQVVTGFSPDKMLACGLSRSFQITNLFFDLSVHENLRLAGQYLERGKGWWSPVENSQLALSRADELLRQFGLVHKSNELAGHLAHGEQRRLEIAVSLATKPRMLLLDEPTQGMSHADTQETAALIARLASEFGLSVLLVEHDVDLVMRVSDHVVVMAQGMKIADGTPEVVRANPDVQKAYFGDKH
jgi:branched-chain amino acid transport system ATP-binding protein